MLWLNTPIVPENTVCFICVLCVFVMYIFVLMTQISAILFFIFCYLVKLYIYNREISLAVLLIQLAK